MKRIERNIFLYRLFAALSFTPFMSPVIALFWQENGLDLFEIYVLQASFAIAIAILEVPTGMVADRMGKRLSLLASSIVLIVGIIYYAIATSFWAFFVAEVIIALGASLRSGADSALLYDTLAKLERKEDYTKLEGQSHSIQLIAFAISSLLGGVIGSYSLALAIWATLLGPILGFFISLGFTEVNEVEKHDSFASSLKSYNSLISQSLRFISRHKLVLWLLVYWSIFLGSATWFLWLYQPYMKWSGLPIWAFGIAFASFNIIAAVASHFAYRLQDKVGRTKILWILPIFQIIPSFFLAIFVHPLSFLFMFGHQIARGMLRPIMSERILEHTYADKRATVLSIGVLSGRLFFTISAPILGYVAKHSSLPFNWILQSSILIVLFAIMLAIYPLIPKKYFTVKEQPSSKSAEVLPT